MKQRIRSTTVLCVRRDNKVVMAGDGQVTLGHEVLKSSAKKLRRIYNDKILTGFAGSTADAFALFARFESKLEQFNGNLSQVFDAWQQTRVSVGRIAELMQLESLTPDPASPEDIGRLRGDVSLNHVRFSYPLPADRPGFEGARPVARR